MRRPGRSFALLLAAALAAGACDSTGPDADEVAEQLLVSEPVQQRASALGGESAISANAARDDMEDIDAFVSLAPGSYPDAIVAEVVNRRLARSVPAPIVDGGFDPVGIPAAVGDTVIVNITRAGGELVSIRGRVPARRPPRVVRTYPRPGRTDIAFNAIISAVFSEPVDPETIDQTSMRLSELPGPAVEGSVRLTSASALGVEFVPTNPLLPGKEYRLLVMRTIRDLSGDPLEVQASLDFTTELTGNAVVVTSVTSGADLDPDGYRVGVNGSPAAQLGINGSVSIPDLPAGTHSVSLDELSSNCSVDGGAVREVTLAALETVSVDFTVTCLPSGSVLVTTATSGASLDPDGYEVRVGFGPAISIGTNGSVTIPGLASGEVDVSLMGVNGNCTAAGGIERQVTVPARETATADFSLTCTPDFSPTGRIAFVLPEPNDNSSIWVANADGTGSVRLTDGTHSDVNPAWSPDGTRLAFARGREQTATIHVMNADGTNLLRRSAVAYSGYPAWSPDGSKIAFSGLNNGNTSIYVMDVDGDWWNPVPLGHPQGWNSQPAWTPDGSGIAFVSDWRAFDIVSDVFYMNADGSSLRMLISADWMPVTNLHLSPAWSPDGRRIAISMCAPSTCTGSRMLGIANADGSGLSPITTGSFIGRPSWSPDGATIAVPASDCEACGSGIRYVTPTGLTSSVTIDGAFDPAWKP